MNCQPNLDRRGFLRGTAALGALAAFGGYALNGADVALADSADAGASSRIVIGRAVDSDNLDPVTCIGNQNSFVFNLILEGLVKTSDDGESIEPCLAESWEVSEDGTTYTFTVKPGLLFSDGTPVTAADWEFTFNRAIEAEDSNWHMCVENIDHVECPDDTTVIVVTKEPAASTMANLCIFTLGVQSKAHFDQVGDEGYMTDVIGAGPYMIKEWRKGEYLTLSANPNYREAGLPLTQEIEFKVVAEDTSRQLQLQAGDIDIATDLPFSTLMQLSSDSNVVVSPDPSTNVTFLSCNVANEYLANETVREALYEATDAQEFVDALSYGYATAVGSVFAPTSEFCDHSIEPAVANVEAAKALLAEAGYPDGFSLRVLLRGGNATQEQIAMILMQQWAQIGVTLELDAREATSFSQARADRDFDILVSGWSDDVQDPAEFMHFLFSFDVNYGCFTNFEQPEELVAINDAANVELDNEIRKELYAQIQQAFRKQAVNIPLFVTPWCNAYRTDITGWIQTPLGNFRLEHLAKA